MAQEAARRLQQLRASVQAQRCHRRIITEYLTAYGYDVQHL
jgi:hypothetical protein